MATRVTCCHESPHDSRFTLLSPMWEIWIRPHSMLIPLKNKHLICSFERLKLLASGVFYHNFSSLWFDCILTIKICLKICAITCILVWRQCKLSEMFGQQFLIFWGANEEYNVLKEIKNESGECTLNQFKVSLAAWWKNLINIFCYLVHVHFLWWHYFWSKTSKSKTSSKCNNTKHSKPASPSDTILTARSLARHLVDFYFTQSSLLLGHSLFISS